MSVINSDILTLFEIGILVWVGIVIIVWLTIRHLRPNLLGLGDNFNEQIIDGVKLAHCPHCNNGQLAPYWEQIDRRIIIGIPPGLIYVVGPPDEYRCTKCDYRTHIFDKKKFTRISLAYTLPEGYLSKFLVKFLLMTLLVIAFAVVITLISY